jgi:hypothetical protein
LSTYNIVQLGDDILREKARLVPRITPNIIKLLDNMANTMYSAKGVGLAAPQVGVSKRVIVVDTGEGLYGLINPEIVKATVTGLIDASSSFEPLFSVRILARFAVITTRVYLLSTFSNNSSRVGAFIFFLHKKNLKTLSEQPVKESLHTPGAALF